MQADGSGSSNQCTRREEDHDAGPHALIPSEARQAFGQLSGGPPDINGVLEAVCVCKPTNQPERRLRFAGSTGLKEQRRAVSA